MQEHDDATQTAYKFYTSREIKDESLNAWFALSHIQQKNNISQMLQKYPSKTPIIILSATDQLLIPNPKLLFPTDMTCSSLKCVIRKKMGLTDKTMALFVYTTNNKLIADTSTIREVMLKTKSTGLLYLKIANEEVFG